jgi:hypothetical protein
MTKKLQVHTPDAETEERLRLWLQREARMFDYAAPYELLDALASGKLMIVQQAPQIPLELGYIHLDAFALSPAEVREVNCPVCGNALEPGQVYTVVYTNGNVGGICCKSCTEQ